MLPVSEGRSLFMCHFMSSLSEGEGLARLRIGYVKQGCGWKENSLVMLEVRETKATCAALDPGERLRP